MFSTPGEWKAQCAMPRGFRPHAKFAVYNPAIGAGSFVKIVEVGHVSGTDI